MLITEEDTTVSDGPPDDRAVFPMTWSPIHCLEELFEPRAFAARDGHVVGLGHRPTEQYYRARCGDRVIGARGNRATLGRFGRVLQQTFLMCVSGGFVPRVNRLGCHGKTLQVSCATQAFAPAYGFQQADRSGHHVVTPGRSKDHR